MVLRIWISTLNLSHVYIMICFKNGFKQQIRCYCKNLGVHNSFIHQFYDAPCYASPILVLQNASTWFSYVFQQQQQQQQMVIQSSIFSWSWQPLLCTETREVDMVTIHTTCTLGRRFPSDLATQLANLSWKMWTLFFSGGFSPWKHYPPWN